MPRHVIVDGSNLATEGRAMPSLHQLNDAVMAFINEHPDALITVVVDATFGHRIPSSEVAEFDAAVANNELVAPPAGAIGRGDAFLLSVANKVGGTVLSNDSFQEFHGTYTWLFDEGRLIGGKPVPHIGWVFVARSPVRGPISRSAVKEARRKKDGGASPAPAAAERGGRGGRGRGGDKRQASSAASLPMPVPKAPPPNATVGAGKTQAGPAKQSDTAKPAATATTAVNDFMSFLSFVEHHPVGTSVNATVESYSSHGAYVRLAGDVVGYVPLRLMADPPPRSAREFLKLGDSVTLVVESFAPARRSIDLATTSMATAKTPAPAKKATKASRKKAAADATETTPAIEAPPATTVPEKPSRRKKASASPAATAVEPHAAATAAKTPKPAKAAKAAKAARATKATHPDVAPDVPAKKASRSKKAAPPVADAESAPAAPTPAAAAKPRRAKKGAAPAADSPAQVDPAAESAAAIDTAAPPARRRRAPATRS